MTAEQHLVRSRPEQATIPTGHSWNRLPVIAPFGALLGGWLRIWDWGIRSSFLLVVVSFLLLAWLCGRSLLLIQYASQGGWSIVLRRIGETTFARSR